MGLGLRGARGLAGAIPEILISGSAFSSPDFSGSTFSAAGSSTFVSADFSETFSSVFLPRISSVVATAISVAGITSPSSGGSGAAGIFGSGKVVLRTRAPVVGRACGTLKSRTVGSGTGSPSAPRPERETSSCNFFAWFSRSRARRSRACSSGGVPSTGASRRPQMARSQLPSWKLVRKSMLMK
jgi:hypothetical protein